MLLGVLVTGHVRDDLDERHGTYGEMFARLFRTVDPTLEMRDYLVIDGVFPDNPTACDGWIVTGSKFGVYDPEPWIPPLKQFLRDVRAARVPLAGICFGHQIMAEAFGGRAEKSGKGWGAGAHDYQVSDTPGWLAGVNGGFTMHALHQDQVTEIPVDATCHASSDFCPYAVLSYGSPEAPDAISIQPHPEFEQEFMRDLVTHLSGGVVPEEVSKPALSSLGRPVAARAFAESCLEVFRQRRRSDLPAK